MEPKKARIPTWNVALLVVLVGLVVALAVLPRLGLWPDSAQREAIGKLEQMGAALEFDDYRNVKALRIPPGCSLEALRHVSALPKLKSLVLPVTEAENDDLAPLQTAVSLEELILSGNPGITDEGLKNLANLVNLKMLYLTDVPIEGPGLEALSRLPKLNELNLSYTKLDDDDFAHLGQLSALRVLDLSYTECTDAGLKHLAGLKNLEQLWVMGAKATPEGAAELKKSLPNVTVRFGL